MIETYQLIKQIKQSENELVPMAVETVAKCLNIFTEYMNCVVDIEVYSRSVAEWSKTTEYLFRQKDERRRETHTLAAEACRTLNKIYNNGISGQRTFDEILNEFADRHIVFEEKTADQLFNGED